MTRMLIAATFAAACLAGPAAAQQPAPVNGDRANGGAPPAPAARAADPSAEYQIGPEDVLDISVWKNPELSRKVPVRPDGRVSLPLINDIQAAGLTPSALRDQLTQRLGEFVPSPEVSVIVQEVHSLKVSVVGAVKMPGRFELKSPATVLECIALAQGLTEFANRDRIVVIRQNNRIPFNYGRVSEGNGQENFFVRPGDIIVVP